MPSGNMKRWARGAAELALPIVFAISGCGEKLCVEGLDIGTTYKVTVLEPANANSQYGVQTSGGPYSQGPDFGVGVSSGETCGAGFDLVAGSTFLLEPVSKEDRMDCYGLVGDVSSLQGTQDVQLAQQPFGPMMGGGDFLSTQTYEMQKGGCSGQWQLDFDSSGSPPLNTPVPGEYPPVVLQRTFQPSDTTDIQSCLLPASKLAEYGYCSDGFIVKLEKT
jgi:hypothetical protein